jgi:hypothetical protein
MMSVALRRTAQKVGLISTVTIIVISLVVAALLDPATFAGPVATFVLSYLIGLIAEVVFIATVGAGQGASASQIAMFSIIVVVAAFWLGVLFEGWPFARISNGIVATVALLLTVYLIALIIYYASFNFAFLPAAAQTSRTPTGLFDAWHVLTFLVTAISGMFLPPAFGFLGFERVRQPLRGSAWTALCLVWSTLLFGIGVYVIGVGPVDFLVWVPVPLLFGGLIILVVFRDSLFGGQPQRLLRGVSDVLVMTALGIFLVWIYHLVAGLVSPALSWGAPTYQGQVWIASATLAFTFPLLATHADFFDHWPLRTRGSGRSAPPAL